MTALPEAALDAAHLIPFALVFAVTLGIMVWASRRTRTVSDFLVAGGQVSAWQNALAMAGDFVAAAGLLGITGLIALFGADGMVFAIGIIAGWPLMLFLFAAPLKQLGKYTMGDVLVTRLGAPHLRSLVAITQLVVILTYLTAQFVGAASILHLLFGLSSVTSLLIVFAGMLAITLLGGMLAVTWLQIVKATLMMVLAIGVLVACLARFGFDPLAMLRAGVAARGAAVFQPGRLFSGSWETLSLLLGLALGGASLPHVLMRMNTVADPRAARRSAFLGTSLIVVFHLVVLCLGIAAIALLPVAAVRAADPGGNMALPLLAHLVGGDLLLGFVASIALATILAVVAGLGIAGTATLSHDLWVNTLRRGNVAAAEQLLVGRIASVLLSFVALGLGYLFQGQNISFVSALGLAIAASANFPALLLAIFWRRFTAAGAFAGMATGLVLSLTLIWLSPLIQVAVLHREAAIFPLQNPGIVAIPAAFVVAILVSLGTRARTRAPFQAVIHD